jgi:hypothetical protein
MHLERLVQAQCPTCEKTIAGKAVEDPAGILHVQEIPFDQLVYHKDCDIFQLVRAVSVAAFRASRVHTFMVRRDDDTVQEE